MRISDWSSDVCSSDLRQQREFAGRLCAICRLQAASDHIGPAQGPVRSRIEQLGQLQCLPRARYLQRGGEQSWRGTQDRSVACLCEAQLHGDRSEEHTSELQSLMRISYAVFCLKKKTIPQLKNI